MTWPWGRQRSERKILAAVGVAGVLVLGSLSLLLWLAQGEPNSGLGWAGGSPGLLLVGGFFCLNLGGISLLLTFLYQEAARRHAAESRLTEAQDRLRSLTSQLCLAEERERRRIAVYLHDNIGQKLAIAAIKLGQLTDAAAAQAALLAGLDEVRQLLKQIIQDTKSLTFKISSPILYELGLEAALEQLTEEFQEQHGLITFFADDDQPKPVAAEVRVLLFQAVNELLLNVVKHAKAREAQVAVRRENGQINISVHDDGVGFDVAAMRSRWGRKDFGFGLFSIKERLQAFGGVMDIRSGVDGTTVTLRAPIQEE